MGKEYNKAVICHPNYLCAEYIMWNARLDESQAPIKIARRNINNLRYADDTILMAESEKELKSLLLEGAKGEWKSLKLNIQKTKIMASSPIPSWHIDREKVEAVTDFIFLDSKITVDSANSMKLKDACFLEEKPWQTKTAY